MVGKFLAILFCVVYNATISFKEKTMQYRTYNVKADLPTVELALANIEIEIEMCKSEGVRMLKVIHGYGSSGVGGEIKHALNNWLKIKKRQGLFLDYVKGEELATSKKQKKFKEICPELMGDFELYFSNPGVTLIFIS